MKNFITPFVAFLVTGLHAVSAQESAWPQYGGVEGDFHFKLSHDQKNEALPTVPLWKRPLGPGTSQIVSDGRTLFTLYSVPDPKETSKAMEIIIAMEALTGKTVWEHKYPVARLKGQQTFSGDPIRPQATPALAKGKLCSLGYTGLLKCLDTATGRVLWEIDLVKEFDATPVQFGFSASPLIYRDHFIVHVGGKKASVIAFERDTGKVAWKSEPAAPGYASPVLAKMAGSEQFLQITRDSFMGISPENGATLWKYPLAQEGLTNVPTPIALPNDQVLISGQGILGTRLLKVVRASEKWQVSEVWANKKERFFYCNWARDGDRILGNNGNFLTAFQWSDGKELWRERGQNESNQIMVGSDWLVLKGNGGLTRFQINESGPKALESTTLFKGRCWTAPTVACGLIIARDQAEIAALSWKPVSKN